MAILGRKAKTDGDRILYVPTSKIEAEIKEVCRESDVTGIEELAASIGKYGILEPLLVCSTEKGYDLIAGRRRLRAAEMAGLHKVPCIVMKADAKTMSALSLCENLHRREYDEIDLSRGVFRYMQEYGENAARVGKTLCLPPARIGETLELMKLTGNELSLARRHGLTVRQLRALLKIREAEARERVFGQIITNQLSDKETEALVDGKLTELRRENRIALFLRDERVFLNTVSHGVDILRSSGIEADMSRSETEDTMTVTITIAKARQ